MGAGQIGRRRLVGIAMDGGRAMIFTKCGPPAAVGSGCGPPAVSQVASIVGRNPVAGIAGPARGRPKPLRLAGGKPVATIGRISSSLYRRARPGRNGRLGPHDKNRLPPPPESRFRLAGPASGPRSPHRSIWRSHPDRLQSCRSPAGSPPVHGLRSWGHRTSYYPARRRPASARRIDANVLRRRGCLRGPLRRHLRCLRPASWQVPVFAIISPIAAQAAATTMILNADICPVSLERLDYEKPHKKNTSNLFSSF